MNVILIWSYTYSMKEDEDIIVTLPYLLDEAPTIQLILRCCFVVYKNNIKHIRDYTFCNITYINANGNNDSLTDACFVQFNKNLNNSIGNQ